MGKYRNRTNLRISGKCQLFTEFTASYTLVRIDNTNTITKTLGLKYQIPSWYRFGIGIPKSSYPIDIFTQDWRQGGLHHCYRTGGKVDSVTVTRLAGRQTLSLSQDRLPGPRRCHRTGGKADPVTVTELAVPRVGAHRSGK